MTDSLDTSLPDTATVSPKRLATGIGVLAVIGACVWGFIEMRSRKFDSEQALQKAITDNEELQKQMANLQATLADIKTADLYQQEEQTLAKDDTSVILDRTQGINERLQELQDAQARWTAAIDDLKDNQTGIRIAGDPALVDLLATILSTAPTDDISHQLTGRLRPMIAQLREALAEDSVSFEPTEAFISRIDEIEDSVSKSNQWYRDHLLQLNAVQKQAADVEPAERSLRSALLSREAERAQERVEKLAERNRQIQREKDATVGAAEAEAQRIISEAEAMAKRLVGEATAARITQAALEEKAKQEEAIKLKKEAERLAQLRREFQRDLADVRTHLHPFIIDGYTYRTDDKLGPVSLSVIKAQGALKEGKEGLGRLCYMGGTTKNDRDRGGFPMYIGGRNGDRLTNWDFVQRAQDLLKKYGEILVEQKILSP